MLLVHAISITCEMGVVTATLLNLFSTLKRHESTGDAAADYKYRNELWITLTSLVSTVLAFMLTVLGAGSLLAGMRKVLDIGQTSLHGSAARSIVNRGHSTVMKMETSVGE